jgi:bacterioferritin-associated ferredoxin
MTSKKDAIACYCNNVQCTRVVEAIKNGARNLSQIYDMTGAGTGPCGGSCRATLKALIRQNVSADAAPTLAPAPEENAPAELIEAISLFNRRYYWETHEVLEGIWMEEHGKPRLFYQGLIQASAALYHVLNANAQGVIRLAEESRNKLRPYSPSFMSVPVEGLLDTLDQYLLQAREILGHTRSGFDYDKLPLLTIGSDMSLPKAPKPPQPAR